jgi:uncharacterized protein (DUF488 family)
MHRTLFTVGHSTHSAEYFVALLKKFSVQQIWDVRSVPYSAHNPQFNRETLQATLSGVGVSYLFLGKEFGARSSNPACYIDGKVQFNYLVDEPIFQHALQKLRKGIEHSRIALMCAERDPLTCHRTILICRELRTHDLQVEHILADGSIETNSSAERRLMSMLNIRPDLLHSEHDCIESAYEQQASRIAYVLPNTDHELVPAKFKDEDLHDRIYE